MIMNITGFNISRSIVVVVYADIDLIGQEHRH
jgi:hypothetical protein